MEIMTFSKRFYCLITNPQKAAVCLCFYLFHLEGLMLCKIPDLSDYFGSFLTYTFINFFPKISCLANQCSTTYYLLVLCSSYYTIYEVVHTLEVGLINCLLIRQLKLLRKTLFQIILDISSMKNQISHWISFVQATAI